MANKFPNGIDLVQTNLNNAVAQVVAGNVGSPVVGQFWYDSSGNQFKVWDGTNSGLNATLLNQNNAAFYLARANHTGTQTASTISDLATVVKAYRLDEFAVPTAPVSFGSQKLTNLLTPTNASDGATKAYVDAATTGFDAKASVRAASTASVTVVYAATGGTSARGQISTAPNTLDGVSLAANDRVALKNQTLGAQNGIWVVTTVGTGVTGVWDRATDFDSDAEVTAGAFFFVEEGTVNADTQWLLTTDNPITIGGATGTSLTIVQFGGGVTYVAGAGLTVTGTTFNVGAGIGIIVNADDVQISTAVVARKNKATLTGSATSYTVAHGAASAGDVVAQVQLISTGEVQYPGIAMDATNITVTFAVAPTASTYRVSWTY